MARTTRAVQGSDPNSRVPFETGIAAEHPMSIPSGCMCTWVIRANSIWVLKFESYLCPFRGRH